MCTVKNCYKTCINKDFLLNEELFKHAQEIVMQLEPKSRIGRPPIDFEAIINGIYFLLKTGMQWKALPNCFGASSALHRHFQRLRTAKFFEMLWHKELQEYDQKHKLLLEVQSGDCAHIKAPLGQEKTGKSPVDRRKLGTKRSIIVEGNGIIIGAFLAPGNRHDSKLLEASISSIPVFLEQPRNKQIYLDSAYDSRSIRTLLFNRGYVPKISSNKRRSKLPPPKVISGGKRWIVESAHSWINRFRHLLVRFDKYAANYFAFMQFAFSIIIFNKI